MSHSREYRRAKASKRKSSRLRLAKAIKMEERKPIESGLPLRFAPYAFGARSRGVYRDIITGNLVVVRTAEKSSVPLEYLDVLNLREMNRTLRAQLDESEQARSQLENAIPLRQSVKGTGEKMVGYVMSGNPTKGNSKKRKPKSDEDVTEPPKSL